MFIKILLTIKKIFYISKISQSRFVYTIFYSIICRRLVCTLLCQPKYATLYYLICFRVFSGCRRVHVRRIPHVRHSVADVSRLPISRIPRSPQLGTLRMDLGSDNSRTQLRHNSRHAPQQKTVVETRRVHHDLRLELRRGHGRHAHI